MNLKDFTDSTYPQGSFIFTRLLKAKDIRVNGVKTGANVQLKAGDIVTYYTTKEQEAKPSHSQIYADGFVYIADKCSGVSCEALAEELKETGDFRPVHRLDRNTCGLIVFAKNDEAERELLQAFKNRQVTKTYQCICKNNFKSGWEVLTAYLKKDDVSAIVKVFDKPVSGGVKIVTEYNVLNSSGGLALVEVILHTGKTHQIRAHLAHIGCPLLGDEKYGDEALNAKYNVKRQRLVAKKLQFNLDGNLAYLNAKTFESKFILEI